MTLWPILARAAALYPEKVAVVDGDRRFTYAGFAARAAALASFFRSRGIGGGDRLSILHANAPEYLETYYAAAGLGAILNPLNHRLAAGELAFILRDAGSRWLVAGAEFEPLVTAVLAAGVPLEGVLWTGEGAAALTIATAAYEAALAGAGGAFTPAAVTDDRVAHLYYTSGTTGQPKGVMLTHRNVAVHALGTIAELGFGDADVWGHFAPLFHLADAWAAFAITWAGGRHVTVPRFEPEAALAAIQRERITATNLVPTMLNLVIHHPRLGEFDTASLRLVLSGGAPIAPELVRRVMAAFRGEYVNTYGMTETSPFLTFSLLKETLRALPPEAQLGYRAKTGRPFLGVELRVVDDAGRPVAPDGRQVGEIQVRGDTITPGYWRRPEATADAFQDGWLRTGDLAVLDAEGYVDIVDRKKDVIITGGENVYSTEVENVLYRHPNVLEAAVFGVPDDRWGEAVRAAVVLQAGQEATAEALIAFCKEHLAAFKAPKAIDLLPALPRTGSGKIQKRVLASPFWPPGGKYGGREASGDA